jgi:uncharacterized membrane protein
MLYIGLYQTRHVGRLWCPLFARGCERVADAPFVRPLGIPDGYLGAALYGLVVILLLVSPDLSWTWFALMGLAVLAAIANVIGIYDMARLGSFCFYCVVTALLSPMLLWAVWLLR